MKKMIVLAIVVMMMMMACRVSYEPAKEINHVSALPGYSIDSLYKEFLKCIEEHPSDAVCDSCWQRIMNGKVDDTYWHEH